MWVNKKKKKERTNVPPPLHHPFAFLSFRQRCPSRPLTYVSPLLPSLVRFSHSHRRRLRLHGDGLCHRPVGGEGVRLVQGQVHLPAEAERRPSEPRAAGTAGAAAHPQPQWLLPQRMEEQQQPALLLQGPSIHPPPSNRLFF